MKNGPNVVGIGCFAKPEVLRRVFKKTLESYILGSFEGLALDSDFSPIQEGVIQFLEDILTDGTEIHPFSRFEIGRQFEPIRITGFFLGYEKQHLTLSIFFLGAGHHRARYTTKLEMLRKIRNKRLNRKRDLPRTVLKLNHLFYRMALNTSRGAGGRQFFFQNF